MKFSRYNWVINGNKSFILYNGFTGAILEDDDKICALMISNSDIDRLKRLDDKRIKLLYSHGYLIDDDYDEIRVMQERFDVWQNLTRYPISTIVITTSCNFNCPYCFEKMKKPDVITTEVINKYILTLSMCDYHTHMLVLFGGEPLLAHDKCIEVLTKAKEALATQNKNLHGCIITNGYLLDRTKADELAFSGVKSVQITVDGTEENHNMYRTTRDKKKTYKKILSNAIYASNRMRVTIRCNVYNGMCMEIDSLRKVCQENDIHFKISPVLNSQDRQTETDNIQYCKKHLTIEDRINSASMYGKYPCIALARSPFNGTVLMPNGEVYRCWEQVANNEKPSGSVFSLYDGLDRRWEKWNPYRYEACKQCKMLPTCSGGCPYQFIKDEKPLCPFSDEQDYENYIIANYQANTKKGGE